MAILLHSADSRRASESTGSTGWPFSQICPRKSVVRWTDRPDMTIVGDWAVKNQTKKHHTWDNPLHISRGVRLFVKELLYCFVWITCYEGIFEWQPFHSRVFKLSQRSPYVSMTFLVRLNQIIGLENLPMQRFLGLYLKEYNYHLQRASGYDPEYTFIHCKPK